MLEGVQGIEFGYVLCGIIWAIALGFAVGNYACSLVHRLPRGRLLLDKTPYCGTCGTLLKVQDLFPAVSAIMLKHRCRYCGSPFPVSHTWTELLVGLLFVLAFLQYNFTEPFLLIITVGVFLITLAAIEANEKMLIKSVLVVAVIAGIIYRVLVDGTIYNAFNGGLLGLILGVILKRKEVKKVGHVYSLPVLGQLLAAGGLIIGGQLLAYFLMLFATLWLGFWLIGKAAKKVIPITVPFGFAVTLLLLYPDLLYRY